MFQGGIHGLLGEEKKPKPSPPVSREPEFEDARDAGARCREDRERGSAGIRPNDRRGEDKRESKRQGDVGGESSRTNNEPETGR